MSGRASKGDAKGSAEQGQGASQAGAPRHSHVRELTPRSRAEIEIDDESTNDDSKKHKSGFFSQSTRIKMGDTFPALKTVARFLTLESYRSLPKPDKLPDLSDIDDTATPHSGEIEELELEDIEETSEDGPGALLDWDEMEIDSSTKTPYQLYLFDLRIEGYLRETKAKFGPRLVVKK